MNFIIRIYRLTHAIHSCVDSFTTIYCYGKADDGNYEIHSVVLFAYNFGRSGGLLNEE